MMFRSTVFPLFAATQLLAVLSFMVSSATAAVEVHVSPSGDDAQKGSAGAPVRTLAAAQARARRHAGKQRVEVIVADGIYYLDAPLRFTDADSGTAEHPVVWRAAREGGAVISGGQRLELAWQAGERGIWTAEVPAGKAPIDQLYLNGQRQRMARFPNAEPAPGHNVFDTWRLVMTREPDPERDPLARADRWRNPEGGFIHAMHQHLWGDMKWRIRGRKADGSLDLEGGWQNNRPTGMHPRYRMVENIFEELDAPGEWFHDRTAGRLHVIPPEGLDLATAIVETVNLPQLVEFAGAPDRPVRHLSLDGFTFRHAARTFMENKEPLLRSDWTVSRSGAVFFEGAADCTVENCTFDQVGGNAIFVSNWNRRIIVRGCHIFEAGASGVVFVGDPDMVRSPLFRYGGQPWDQVDRTPGPKGDNFPQDCLVEDCLIVRIGRDEKQTAGVQISMSHRITVRHCSIYEVPRAGINISEGAFGGHVIEFCDVFDTVLETNDHGSFNSWGRDRFWQPDIRLTDEEVARDPNLPFLDILGVTVIRNSRWRCEHGWDVDLDDGSTRYEIYNNLMLYGGLKLREGYDRNVYNNIVINNSLHPHVWYQDSGDVFTRNIVMGAYRPAIMHDGHWGREIDRNFFFAEESDRLRFAANGADAHSLSGDPKFLAPEAGDFRVADDSPARQIGFVNFPMDRFGVRKPSLRAIARTPEIPRIREVPRLARDRDRPAGWLGAGLRDLEGEEFSAFGIARSDGGVHLATVPEGSPAYRAGFRAADVILRLNGRAVAGRDGFFRLLTRNGEQPLTIVLSRNQALREITLDDAPVVAWETQPLTIFGLLPLPARPVACTLSAYPATRNEPLSRLLDGGLARNYGPVFPNRTRAAVYRLDLGAVKSVVAIHTWTYRQGPLRVHQSIAFFGSTSESDPGYDVSDASKWIPLGAVDTLGISLDAFLATRWAARPGDTLGRFRWIAWAPAPLGPDEEFPAVQELHVEVAR